MLTARTLHGSGSTKFPVLTVEVTAITEPPASGFMSGGQRVPKGGKIRLPLGEAQDLERRGKGRIVNGSEREEML